MYLEVKAEGSFENVLNATYSEDPPKDEDTDEEIGKIIISYMSHGEIYL